MRTTEHFWIARRSLARKARAVGQVIVMCLACGLLLAVSGCSGGGQAASSGGSSDPTKTVGAHMGGESVEVHVSKAAIDTVPNPPVLTTPKSAVKSYLDWTSYAYRVGQSRFATPTASAKEMVRVDALAQYYIQKKRFMDGTLLSITFGKESAGPTSTILPAKEEWTYKYLSTESGNKVVGGPYNASYDTTYTVAKNKKGDWVVDLVQAKAKGPVK